MADFLFSEEPIRVLQDLLAPSLDLPFLIITASGSQLFLLSLAVVVYWLGRKRLGFLLAVVLLASGSLNTLLKATFGMPRPPAELHRSYASGNGFPSGHAQQSTTFWVTASLMMRGPWPLIAATLVTLVALSRVYLGVHYVGDVLGGVAFGALASFLLVVAYRSVPWTSLAMRKKVLLAVALPAVFPGSLLLMGLNVVSMWGLLTGILLGYLLESEWVDLEPPYRWESAALRLAIGIPTLGGLWVLGWRLEAAGLVLGYHAFLGVMATLILPWIFGMVEAIVLRGGGGP